MLGDGGVVGALRVPARGGCSLRILGKWSGCGAVSVIFRLLCFSE